jgi:hypothetical protein
MEFGWPFLYPSGPKREFPSPRLRGRSRFGAAKARPSPAGRGRVFLRRSAKPIPSAISQTGQNCSLSRWERAGVRGILAHLISTGSGVLTALLHQGNFSSMYRNWTPVLQMNRKDRSPAEPEIRNPKAEGRKKSETRNPNQSKSQKNLLQGNGWLSAENEPQRS